jgi:hypothetical protein
MGPHRKLGIYIGYETPSIIKYLEPMTGDLHMAWYADCVFDDDHFPALGGDRHPEQCQKIEWNASGMQSLDPRTSESKLEVQRIIHLQGLANKLPDAFTDHKRVTRLHIPVVNTPKRVQVPQKATNSIVSPNPRKRGRPLGAQDKVPRRRPQKRSEPLASLKESVEEARPEVGNAPEVATQPEVEKVPKGLHPKDGNPNVPRANYCIGRLERPSSIVMGNHDEWEDDHEEIATNYVESGESYHRKTTIVHIYFASKIADLMDLDPEPKSMIECQKLLDWNKLKAAIEAELRSLHLRGVFGSAIPTPPKVIPVGCKWVFLQKRNEHGQVVRYKARLVAQGFTQRPDIDYDETYSPVMSGITFRYLISMAANLNLKMQLMDVVTAYLYGSLDSEIYMRVPEGLKIPGPN